jgi:hypothetical protein
VGSLSSGALPPRALVRRGTTPPRYPNRDEPYAPATWHWVLFWVMIASVMYGAYEGFWLWRTTLERVYGIVFWRNEWFPTAYLSSMTTVGIVLFSIVVGGESYIRGVLVTTYYPPGSYILRLIWRYVLVLLILAPCIGGALAVQEWAFRNLT